MAVINWSSSKFYFRYTSTSGSESSTRTISGLNYETSGGAGVNGPEYNTGITNLINAIQSLTTSTISNVRYIRENEVNI